MKKQHKFVVVNADDWQALYIDGKVVAQQHSVQLEWELAKYGVDIEEVDAYSHPGLDDVGRFPDRLSEVVLD